jgi:hypothetical protein
MSDVTGSVHHPSDRYSSDHARHDRLLVTRFAAGDADSIDSVRAHDLVAACGECARLADDIRTLIGAVHAMPTPPRTRDFRLTADDIERLEGSALDRLLRRLASPGYGRLRPVAGVALSLGLALAATGTLLPTASPAFAPARDRALPAAAESADQFSAGGGGAEAPDNRGRAEAEALSTAGPQRVDDSQRAVTDALPAQRDENAAPATTDPLRELLLYTGLILAILSLAVLIVISYARRATRDAYLS